MSNFLVLHAIQAFGPSLLNRSDDGTPKQIAFGGTQRQRVSSQCWKRAMRTDIRTWGVDGGAFATRTRKLPRAVAEALTALRLAASPADATDPAAAQAVADRAAAMTAALFDALKLKTSDDGNTKTSLFVPEDAGARIATVLDAEWEQGMAVVADPGASAFTPGVLAAAIAAFDVGNAIDLALSGRMLAEIPGQHVNGAVQVPDVIGVTELVVEEDFFTAIDDLARQGEALGSMMGTTALTTGVFYRHAVIDRRELRRNLAVPGTDAAETEALAARAEAAFVKAFVLSVPSSKKNSTAPNTLPAVVLAQDTDRAVSHADAFLKAVEGPDVMAEALDRLLTRAARADALVGGTTRILAIDPEAAGRVPAAMREVAAIGELAAA